MINSLFARPRARRADSVFPALAALVADVKVNLGIVASVAVHLLSSYDVCTPKPRQPLGREGMALGAM